MLGPYPQSAVLIYSSTCATSLKGTIVSFFELSDNPVLFSIISSNKLCIYMFNPFFSFHSFVNEISDLLSSIASPVYLFPYDKGCFAKYKRLFSIDFLTIFEIFQIISIDSSQFSSLESFYSFTLPELYGSYFTPQMFLDFTKTKDFTYIINFVRSIMFSKLVLVIDSCSSYKFSLDNTKDIAVSAFGSSVCSIPPSACLLDIQTLGFEEYSDIICCSVYHDSNFTTYYLRESTSDKQIEFRSLVSNLIAKFDVVYVLNASFESTFFPSFTHFVDIRFGKYQSWAATRKLVHLPFYHTILDPGSGKNVPIWHKLFLIEHDPKWRDLLLYRVVVNIFTKLAILASNELIIPYSDPIVADSRRLIPADNFLNELFAKPFLFTKKIRFYPVDFFDTYNFADGQFSHMYEDQVLFSEDFSEEK